MGKSKRKKKNKNKSSSPLQKNERRRTTAQQNANQAMSGLQSTNAQLVAALKSLKVSDRESACLAIAHLFSSESVQVAQSAKDLLRDGLLRALLPRLSDPSPSVRLHASGALRNLSSFSSNEVCDMLVKDDVITPVMSCLRTLSNSFPTLTESNASSESEPVWLFAEQILAVLINLCEENELATRDVSKGESVQILLDWVFRGAAVLPPQVRIPASRLLHTISDENRALAQLIMSDTTLPNRILSLVQQQEEFVELRLSMVGFLINACMQYSPHQLGTVVTIMPTLLKEMLQRRVGAAAAAAAAAAAVGSSNDSSSSSSGGGSGGGSGSGDGGGKSSTTFGASTNQMETEGDEGRTEEMDMESSEEIDMSSINSKKVQLTPVQDAERHTRLVLEIFSNVLSFVNEEDGGEEGEGAMMSSSSSSSSTTKESLRQGMMQWMTDVQMIDMTCTVAGITADQFCTDAFGTFTTHARGMNVLSSMLPLCPSEIIMKYLPLCWPRLYQTLSSLASFNGGSSGNGGSGKKRDDDHVSEYACATLLATSRFARAAGTFNVPFEFQESHSNVVQACATNSNLSSNCRCAALALVSAIASIPHNDATHIQLASVAVQVLQQDPDLVVVAEALDVLFDMFCEDVLYMNVFVQMGLLSQLETFLPLIRQRFKRNKMHLHDIEEAVVKEGLQNLQAFIEYKKSK